MTESEQGRVVVEDFVREIPESTSVMQEHLEDNFNKVLPHVLMADLTRWIIGLERAASQGDVSAAASRDHAPAFLEQRFADARDLGARDVIGASFLENLNQAGQDYAALRSQLGPTLKAALPPR